jgi:hypothetical protein
MGYRCGLIPSTAHTFVKRKNPMRPERIGNEPPVLANPVAAPPGNPLGAVVAKPLAPTHIAVAIPILELDSYTIGAPQPAMQFESPQIAAGGSITASTQQVVQKRSLLRRVLWSPFYFLARSLDLFSLLLLIAIVAAIPLLQFISLGYLLVAGSRLAEGRPWSQSLPGLRLAGKLGVFALLTGLLWLPVIIVADLAHSAELLDPGSRTSAGWRIGAFLLTVAWLVHVGWAALRGGRWWHLFWPAPLKFLLHIWRPSTWNNAADKLYDFVVGLHLPKLWWLGARATIGALMWLALPVSLMIAGLRWETPFAPLFGLIGSLMMAWVMFYLPFFQMLFAQSGSMNSFLAIRKVRKDYAHAPWAHTLALVMLSTLAIPLYLLRIEATPSELTWLPSLFFALLMLPTKLLTGWAIGYSHRRQANMLSRSPWWSRFPAKVVGLSAVGFYVGALFVAQLIAAQGAYVMYFQHAFLVPNPLMFGY